MSGNALYDDIKNRIIQDRFVDVDSDIFSSIKLRDKQYLENIYSIIICFYIEQYFMQGYPIETILASLTTSVPYNGRILNPTSRKGLSFKIVELPRELLVFISFYLKNYFSN